MATIEDANRLLTSKRAEDRARAVHLVARGDGPARQALLLKALTDRIGYVAAAAAEALGHGADDEAASRMTDRFLHLCEDGKARDPGCHIRAKLAFSLGQLVWHPARQALRVGIRTQQWERGADTAAPLRGNCALALSQIRDAEALRDISLLLFEPANDNSSARRAAAEALGRLAEPKGVVPLAIKLAYPGAESADVLQECMQSLVALEDERALECLEPYLDYRDRHLAAFAGVMIAQSRLPGALDLILDALGRFRGDPLRALVLAIHGMRTTEAEAALRRLAAAGPPEPRAIAQEILGHE